MKHGVVDFLTLKIMSYRLKKFHIFAGFNY